jgi:predicted PurR-regulated permease PerM
MLPIQRTAFILIIIFFGAIILKEGSFLFVPLVWGVFFAFALYPISSWLERRRMPRGLAIGLSIFFVALVGFGIIYLLLNQVLGLITDIPEISENLENKLSKYLDEITLLVGDQFLNGSQKPELRSFFNPQNLNTTLLETGKSIILIGIIPLFTFLLMYYKDFFVQFLNRYSTKNNDQVINWAIDSAHVIQSYLSGMLRVTGIVALMAGIFFYFIGVKYFILFAAFIAIMNLIPFVGVFLSSFFAILYVFLTTDTMIYPVITFAVLWGIQLFENNIITPIVVGSQVKVNALAVILAILVGGWLWGISGMVLFIPLIGVLKITLERIPESSAFGYLLSDDVPVSEEEENYWKVLIKKITKKSVDK